MNAKRPHRARNTLLALAGLVGLTAFGAVASEATANSGQLYPYLIQSAGFQDVAIGESVEIWRSGDGQHGTVRVDGITMLNVGDVPITVVSEITGGNNQQSYSDTTITDLPGGGTRVDINHGDGSSTTVITDPNGGPNGGTRESTGHTTAGGDTTVVTTTTDGSDGSKTTTVGRF